MLSGAIGGFEHFQPVRHAGSNVYAMSWDSLLLDTSVLYFKYVALSAAFDARFVVGHRDLYARR